MNDEIKINISNGSISFINNGIGFSQFGVAREILDLIINLQQENERLKELNICVGCNNNPDYKTRNEKALYYIRHNKQKIISAYGDNEDDDFEICLWEEDLDKLENILNGGD